MESPKANEGGLVMTACGLDFGTSNSALGVLVGGQPVLAALDGEDTLLPSAIFFDLETKGRVLFGQEAIAASIAQQDGRLMRALKTILGSPLIDEATAVGTRRIKLTDVIETFIRHMKAKAETFLDEEITQVVHGRPVRFVDHDDDADARAQRVLEEIARRAGFRDIRFVYEPIAAAYHYEESVGREEIVLVADIGGGTSDFTVIRIGPERRGRADRTGDVLSNRGVRIGGTDFDTLLSLVAVMPLLGLGTKLIEKDLPMPKSVYFELATWAMINFTYTYRTEREVRELLAGACEPDKVRRLLDTITHRLGHRIAFAVEDAKIGLSEVAAAPIPLEFVEAGLAALASRAGFDAAIREKTDALTHMATACVADAGVKPDAIHTVFLTGGSSRVPAVQRAISLAAPGARATTGSDFLSVALGLTREAARLFA
jgi:hypothetical chaperone protein